MPRNLLVADDSVVIQKSIGITFAQEDFAITYVNNGNDAILKAKQIRPDFILADVVMPQKNGYEVCETIRQDPQLKQVPVLLLAGTHEAFDEAKSKAVGANGYIIKPFESQALLDRVSTMLAQAAAAPAPPPPQAAAAPSAPRPPQKPAIPPQAPAAQPAAPPPPSLASTIAGQAPSRDAPMLDIEAGAAEPVFDLALDQTEILEAPVVDASAVAAGPPQAETSGTLPAGDFWDFSADSTPATVETAIPAPEPEAPAPAAPVDESAWGTISAGSWDEIEKTPPPPPEEPTFGEPAPAAPESPAEFDFSAAEAPIEAAPVEDATSGAFEPASPEPHFEAPTRAAIDVGVPAVNLSEAQIEAIVTKVFQRVIERIAWEVVPDLAETIIKEELARLTQDRS